MVAASCVSKEVLLMRFVDRSISEDELNRLSGLLKSEPFLLGELSRLLYTESLLFDLGKGNGESLDELDFLDHLEENFQHSLPELRALPLAKKSTFLRQKFFVRVLLCLSMLLALILMGAFLSVPFHSHSVAGVKANFSINSEPGFGSLYVNKIISAIPLVGENYIERNTVPSGLPKLHSIRMFVTQSDIPLANAVVTVIAPQNSVWSCVGTTNDHGEVSLYTNGSYPGVPEGNFHVLVSKIVSGKTISVPDEPDPRNNRAEWVLWQKKYFGPHMVPKTWKKVDPLYENPSTTPLIISVTSSSLEFHLDVGDEVSIPDDSSPLSLLD